jgi:hypothetical protein
MPSLQNQIRSSSVSQLFSDATWLTLADSPPNNFADVDYDDSSWSSAFIISPYPLWHKVVQPVSQDPSAELLLSGSWIWTTEMNNTAQAIPPAIRPFRKKVMSPADQVAVSANISVTVDDTFTFFVNGKAIGNAPATQTSWGTGFFFPDVPMNPSVNVFAISATNLNDATPGSVLVGISMVYVDVSVTASANTGGNDAPNTTAISNSILKTALSVRTSFLITAASLYLIVSEELCYCRAPRIVHERFKFRWFWSNHSLFSV